MIRQRLFHYWRILATGLCFSVFGLGGVFLGLVLLPCVALSTNDQPKRIRRCRRTVQLSFRLFIKLMQYSGVLSYETTGAQALNSKGKLVIANHPTLIDVVFLIAHTPNASCIVKSSLFRNPFTRGPVTWSGYIANSDAQELLLNCKQQLEQGANLIIFPEGTRSRRGKLLKFKRGAAYIWLQSDCDLLLATLNSSPPTLTKETAWYQVPERRFHYTMGIRRLAESSLAQAGLDRDNDVRQVNRLWQEYFQRELVHVQP